MPHDGEERMAQCALVARNGITSHVRTLDPKQYLKMAVMTGNAKCALLGRNSLLS